MNIAIPVNQFNINNVFFQDAIKNTIMDDSNFIRIIYSDDICTFNGLCLEFNLHITNVDKSFNKIKFTFDNKLSNNIIQIISKIEYDIISKYDINNMNKEPVLRINDQLKHGIIKVLQPNKCQLNNINAIYNKKFIVKISGLWSNELEYGLTYKFIQC